MLGNDTPETSQNTGSTESYTINMTKKEADQLSSTGKAAQDKRVALKKQMAEAEAEAEKAQEEASKTK